MKKFLFIFLLISVSLNGFSQETQYKTITNIPYYDNIKQNSDVYLKERCVLDIYYPVNKKDFATIVWFTAAD